MNEKSDAVRAVERWRRTGPELSRIHDAELRAMTDEEILEAADQLLQLIPHLPPKQGMSGLVEQQRVFGRLRK